VVRPIHAGPAPRRSTSMLAENMSNSDAMSPKGVFVFRWCGIIFGSVFLFSGLYLTFNGYRNGIKQKSTVNWTSTNGEITYLDFTKVPKDDDEGGYVVFSLAELECPIKYQYAVDGIQYISSTIIITDQKNLSGDRYLQLLNKYEIGMNVPVFYNPALKSESVLVIGDNQIAWNGMGFGILFSSFALVWMLGWYYGTRSMGYSKESPNKQL